MELFLTRYDEGHRIDGEGGVSHFNYARDNLLLSWMHLRLVAGFGVRLPLLAARRVLGREDGI